MAERLRQEAEHTLYTTGYSILFLFDDIVSELNFDTLNDAKEAWDKEYENYTKPLKRRVLCRCEDQTYLFGSIDDDWGAGFTNVLCAENDRDYAEIATWAFERFGVPDEEMSDFCIKRGKFTFYLTRAELANASAEYEFLIATERLETRCADLNDIPRDVLEDAAHEYRKNIGYGCNDDFAMDDAEKLIRERCEKEED